MVVNATPGAPGTRTDADGPSEWGINDAIIQLREWGTNILFPLPRHPSEGQQFTIGAKDGCSLRLWDPSGRISRRHAALTHRNGVWLLSDTNSKNGVFVDEKRMLAPFPLVPGCEIRIGRTTLVAESVRLVALRELLARFIGMKEERHEEIDRTLFSVRICATLREPLLICGPEILVSIAKQLHRHVFPGRPFVVAREPRPPRPPKKKVKPSTRRKQPEKADALSPPRKGMDALSLAEGGTLCVPRYEEPRDFDDVVAALRAGSSRALLMICAHSIPRGSDIVSQIVSVLRSVLITPLSERADEALRIIDAYTEDALAEFEGGWMTVADREWVAAKAAGSLSQIEMATRRIVALHSCQESISDASKLLGIAHGSLSEWVARRSLLDRSQIPAGEDAREEYAHRQEDSDDEGVSSR